MLSVTAKLFYDSSLIFFFFFRRCQRCCRPSWPKPGPGSGLCLALLCWGMSSAAQLLLCSTLWSCSCFSCYAQLFQKVQSEIGVSLAKSFADSEAVNAISENNCRRNSHVAVGRGNGCVWRISMLPTWGTRRWFVSESQAKSLQQRRLLHVFEGGRGAVLASALILGEWLGRMELFPFCIQEVSLAINFLWVRYRKETA